MNKEKQIEEMARFMCADCANYGDCKYDICEGQLDLATNLYTAGYRKQSEGEWETKDLTKADCYKFYSHICSNCGYFYKDVRPNGYDFCPNCGARMRKEDEGK